jgi:hypothetical protein
VFGSQDLKCEPRVVGQAFLETAMTNFGLSAFFHFKQLLVFRTQPSISVRGGGVLYPGEVEVVTSPAPVHNVADCLNISVLPDFESIHNH